MQFLEQILESTGERVALAKERESLEDVRARARDHDPARDLGSALRGDGISLIAEIKRATPALGDIAPDLQAGPTAKAFEAGGAAAISVLTEPDFFAGSHEDVKEARRTGLPVLCKDFMIDLHQVYDARVAGADAVLVIVRIAPGTLLDDLVDAARSLGMTPLVEVFDETDMARAAEAGADVIGINHRDLHSFEVDPERTAKLAPLAPEGALVVALSGVRDRAGVKAMAAAGADAVLVGEALVTSPDPAAKIAELLGR
jgi:indole-3-glycerol phosphate synthase